MVYSFTNFEKNTKNAFTQLWDNQEFTDVTLATVDDLQIRAHKVILCSLSSFFRNILLKNPHPNPLIYLKDIRYKELEKIIKVYVSRSV